MGVMGHRAMRRFAVIFGVCSLLCHPTQAADCGPTPYACAVFYVGQHNFEEAIHSLTEEIRQSPHDLKALNLLGIALTETGRVENANSRFKQALAINPRFYPSRKNLAINEFNLHHLGDSEAQFHRVLQDAPADEVAHLYLGEISFQRNEFAAALKHYEKSRGRIPQNSAWTLHYAQCLVAQNDLTRAHWALKLLPEADAEDRFQAGLILGRAQAYAEAAEFFGSARKTYSDPYTAGYDQVLMLIQAGKSDEAIRIFNELLGLGYQHPELYNLGSEAFLKAGRVQEAYDALRKATRIDPKAEDNYVDLAALCLQYEEYSLGMEILDIGIHYLPSSYRLYVQRGVTLVMRGQMEEAEKEFQTASTLAPDKSLPYFALGEVWLQSGQTEKAVSVLREKSKLAGVDFLIPYIFAMALIRSGAEPGSPPATEAVQALEQSIALNPSFSHSHAELGKVLFKQGETDHAIGELKAAAALDPSDPGPAYVLAQAYRKKGQKREAEEMLARVAELHSQEHNLDVKKELKRLVRQDTKPSSPAQTKP
jgi:tetratricopeptide (TPR) repeat protein